MKQIAFILVWLFLSAAQAADWVMIESVEKDPTDTKIHPWFFFEPTYSADNGTKLKAGPFSGQDFVFNQNGPQLRDHASFQLLRGFLAARGNMPGTDGKINYFTIADIGTNAATGSERTSLHPTNLQLLDASLTFNYIPFARVRAGQFLTPSSDEMMEAPHTWDFVNFSEFATEELLEYFVRSDGGPTNDPNLQLGSNGCFRDVGVMIFDSFDAGRTRNTYAVMGGNGNGISRWESQDKDKDIYWKWRTEFALDGFDNPKRDYIAAYYWGVNGTRDLYSTPNAAVERFDRKRWGFGLDSKVFTNIRVRAEFEVAEGMIFDGTDGGAIPGAISNNGLVTASFNILPRERADGYLVSAAYDITPQYTLAARYDILNRGTNTDANLREFKNVTLSAQYRFDEHRLNRLMVNYELRHAAAPHNTTADQILASTDNRIIASLLLFF